MRKARRRRCSESASGAVTLKKPPTHRGDRDAYARRAHRGHGDLSPYNILYWSGEPFAIDSPPAVDARSNPNAYELLMRDLENVWVYFARLGGRDSMAARERDVASLPRGRARRGLSIVGVPPPAHEGGQGRRLPKPTSSSASTRTHRIARPKRD